MYFMIYSSPDSFSTINDILILVNNSNCVSAFYKHACHTNSGSNKKMSRIKFIYFNTFIPKVFKYMCK